MNKIKFTSDTAKVTQTKINQNFNDADSRILALEGKTHTSDFINNGADGTSPYATEEYVQQNGGKIDSISVNGTEQTIDEDKNVDISVPTKDSDLTNDRYVRYDTNAQGLNSTYQGNARANIDAQQTLGASNKLSADYLADGVTNKVFTATEQSKLGGVESGAQVNVIESVKSGITTFSPTDKAVDIQGVDNLTNYYTKTDTYTKTEVDGKIASVYKPAGSVAFANLPSLASNVLGNVYNVTDSFTTTNDFVEGAGVTYPAGTNVAVVDIGTAETPVYKFDVLSGFVDLSGYVPVSRKVNNKALTSDISLSASDVGAEPTITKNTAFNKNFETSASNIKMNGVANVGSADTVARADHIHPSDTSKQDQLTQPQLNAVNSGLTSADKTKLDGIQSGAQVNAIESVSAGGVALTPDANKNVNIPKGSNDNVGVLKTGGNCGTSVHQATGTILIDKATDAEITAKSSIYKPITPANLNFAVKSALSDTNHLTMTSAEQETAQSVLGVENSTVTLTSDGETLGAFTLNQSADETIDLGFTFGIARLDE